MAVVRIEDLPTTGLDSTTSIGVKKFGRKIGSKVARAVTSCSAEAATAPLPSASVVSTATASPRPPIRRPVPIAEVPPRRVAADTPVAVEMPLTAPARAARGAATRSTRLAVKVPASTTPVAARLPACTPAAAAAAVALAPAGAAACTSTPDAPTAERVAVAGLASLAR